MATPATAPGRRWRNTPVVRERDERRLRWIWRFLLVAVVGALPLVAYLLQHMEYVRIRYAIEDLRAREARLIESERRLRIERAVSVSLPEVERQAGHELDLARPAAGHVVVVRPEDLRKTPKSQVTPDVSPAVR